MPQHVLYSYLRNACRKTQHHHQEWVLLRSVIHILIIKRLHCYVLLYQPLYPWLDQTVLLSKIVYSQHREARLKLSGLIGSEVTCWINIWNLKVILEDINFVKKCIWRFSNDTNDWKMHCASNALIISERFDLRQKLCKGVKITAGDQEVLRLTKRKSPPARASKSPRLSRAADHQSCPR